MRSPETEKRVIGRLIAEPSCLDSLGLTEQHFVELHTKTVYRAIEKAKQVISDGNDENLVIVGDYLEGHQVTVSDLFEFYPSIGETVFDDARCLKENRQARQLLGVLQKAQQNLQEGESPQDIVERFMKAASSLENTSESKTFRESLRDEIRHIYDYLTAQERGESVYKVFPTGIWSLDELIGGIPIGVPTVLAGRPGAGKSSVCLNIAAHLTRKGLGVHVFSYEDGARSFAQRYLAREAKVSIEDIVLGYIDIDKQRRLIEAEKRSSSMKRMVVEQAHSLTAEGVCSAYRAKKKTLNTKLLIVDYLQLIPGGGNKPRHEHLADCMQTFAALAAREQIGVLILSQLNRDLAKRDEAEPRLSDLRGSGAIEQIAKLCMCLHYRDQESDDLEIHVLKNFQGRRGMARCRFTKRFCNVE